MLLVQYATVQPWCEARDVVRAAWPLWQSLAAGLGFGACVLGLRLWDAWQARRA